MKKQNKIVLSLILVLLLIVIAGYLGNNSRFTFFSIFPIEEEVTMPEVGEGEEVYSFGRKFSNDEGVYVSAPAVVNCEWKPDDEDDGWKNCEAIFEIENKGDVRGFLENPAIIFDFKNGEEIRNVQISYSSNYILEEESILKEEEKVFQEPVEEISGSLITGNVVEEEITSEVESELEEIEVKRRKFSNFKEISQIRINVTLSNETISNESVFNETVEVNSSENIEIEMNESLDINESRINVNENDSEIYWNESFDKGNGSNDRGSEKVVEEEIAEEEAEVIVDDVEIEETLDENLDNYIESSPEIVVSFEEEMKMDGGGESESDSDPSSKSDSEGLDGSIVQGLFISETESERLENVEFGVDVSKPFAIKINFEIPKYVDENFDFFLEDELYRVSLDPEVSACGNLNSANGVYTLSQEVGASGNCFAIGANNITLNCQGNTIGFSSSSNGIGISISNYDHTNIINCNFQSFNTSITSKHGVYGTGSENLVVDNSTFTVLGNADSGTFSGIYLTDDANNPRVTNSIFNVSGSLSYGSLVTYSDNLLFEDNLVVISGSTGYGVAIDTSESSEIKENNFTIFGDTGYGIYISESLYSLVYGNYLSSSSVNGLGIFLLYNSDFANVTSNEISSSGFEVHGISFEGSSNSSVNFNEIVNTGDDAEGIHLEGSSENSLKGNVINVSGGTTSAVRLELFAEFNNFSENTIYSYGVQAHGIDFEDGNSNLFEDNEIYIYESDSFGLDLYSSYNNTFTNIDIFTISDDSFGVYLEEFSIDNIFRDLLISTMGERSTGVNIYASGNYISGFKISTSGQNSPALRVLADLNLSLHNGTLNASYSSVGDFVVNSGIGSGFYDLVNVSFEDKTWAADSNSTLNVSWYLKVTTNYTNGSDAQNVNASIYNRTNSLLQNTLINSSKYLILQEFQQTNSTNEIYYSNYTLNASVGGWNLSSSFNMSSNVNLFFTFGETVNESEESLGDIFEDSSAGSSGSVSSNSGGGSSGGSINAGTISSAETEFPIKAPWERSKRKTLFDINLELIEQEVFDKLLARIGLVNVGESGLTKVVLDYTISDFEGNVLQEGNEIITLETQTQFIKEFDVSDFDQGEYRLLVDLSYEGQQEPARSETRFSVIWEPNLSPKLSKKLIFLTLVLLATVLTVASLLVRKLRSRAKSEFAEKEESLKENDRAMSLA